MIQPNLGMKPSLVDALFTKTQQRVFRLIFGQPDQSFYSAEIIKQAGAGSGAVQRELERLEATGLVDVHRRGRQKYYQANPTSPLFDELTSIVSKTVGVVDPLRKALNPIAPKILAAFVFGSVAKGSDHAASDIDLMIISDQLTYGEIFAALEPAAKSLGRPINPTVYSSAEFRTRMKKGNAFLTKVMAQPRIWVIGSEAEGVA